MEILKAVFIIQLHSEYVTDCHTYIELTKALFFNSVQFLFSASRQTKFTSCFRKLVCQTFTNSTRSPCDPNNFSFQCTWKDLYISLNVWNNNRHKQVILHSSHSFKIPLPFILCDEAAHWGLGKSRLLYTKKK